MVSKITTMITEVVPEEAKQYNTKRRTSKHNMWKKADQIKEEIATEILSSQVGKEEIIKLGEVIRKILVKKNIINPKRLLRKWTTIKWARRLLKISIFIQTT